MGPSVAGPPVTVTSTLPPWPWIAIVPAAVAKFTYPAECVAHRCLGHPKTGPLYYLLGTAGTVPAELSPALQTHFREYHGDPALLPRHGPANDPPQVVAPEVKPGIRFHDLLASATLRGTVAALDAETKQPGMAMAGVARSGLEAYRTHVASKVGTSQETEAMVLLPYHRMLAQHPRVFWLVRGSEAASGALGTYHEGAEKAIVGMVSTTTVPLSSEANASPRPWPSI